MSSRIDDLLEKYGGNAESGLRSEEKELIETLSNPRKQISALDLLAQGRNSKKRQQPVLEIIVDEDTDESSPETDSQQVLVWTDPEERVEQCRGDLSAKNLRSVSISSLKEHQINSKTLVHLNLSYNQLNSVSWIATVSMPKLLSLDLSHNEIQTIQFPFQLALESLNLNYNRITQLHGLRHLEALKTLQLSSNKIHSVFGLENLQQLEKLNLGNNCLRSLMSIRSLSLCRCLRSIILQGNPFARNSSYRFRIISLLPEATVLDDVRLPPSRLAPSPRRSRKQSINSMKTTGRTGRTGRTKSRQRKLDTERTKYRNRTFEMKKETEEPILVETKRIPFASIKKRLDGLSRPRKSSCYQPPTTVPPVPVRRKSKLNLKQAVLQVIKNQASEFQKRQQEQLEKQQLPKLSKGRRRSSINIISSSTSRNNLSQILKTINAHVNVNLVRGVFEGLDERGNGELSLTDWFQAWEIIKVPLRDPDLGLLLDRYLNSTTQTVKYRRLYQELKEMETNPVVDALSKCIETMNRTAPDAPELDTLKSLLQHQLKRD